MAACQSKQEELYRQVEYGSEVAENSNITERFRYMDLEAGTASFDSPEFVRFLERTRDVINDDPELDPNREAGFGYGALLDENLRYDVTGKPAPSIVHYRPGVSSSGPTMDENITERGRASFAAVEEMDLYQIANYQQPFEYVAGPFPLVSTDGRLGLSAYRDNFVVTASYTPGYAHFDPVDGEQMMKRIEEILTFLLWTRRNITWMSGIFWMSTTKTS